MNKLEFIKIKNFLDIKYIIFCTINFKKMEKLELTIKLFNIIIIAIYLKLLALVPPTRKKG